MVRGLAMERSASGVTVTVVAPARLHLGFVDLHGGLGRRFGSLGLALSELRTRVVARHSSVPAALGQDAERLGRYAELLLERHGLENRAHLELEEAIPVHAGLGSGTQLALAVSLAVSELFGLDVEPRQAAAWLQRGARSGIGLAAFEQGGFVLDAGRGADTEMPALIARQAFPSAWRVLLITDFAAEGLSGGAERQAFAELPPMSEQLVGEVSRRVLMQVLPGLAESDFQSFAQGIDAVQGRVGEYFAPRQGGRYASPAVAEVLQWLGGRGVIGLGQSSWGPTGFAFFPSESEALDVRQAALARFEQQSNLGFRICRGRNRGADLSIVRSAAGRPG